MLGPPGAGKSAITNRIVQDVFRPSTVRTIGAAFMSKVFSVNGTELRLDIWDTGGSEKYRALAPMYYRESRVAIVVFDITDPSSQTAAVEWIVEVREKGRSDIVLVGAANKTDLLNFRRVSSTEVVEFGFEHQLDFIFEVSAKTGHNIVSLFDELCRQLCTMPPLEGPEALVSADYIGDVDHGCC
jgi:Ras-related protein Rab-5C